MVKAKRTDTNEIDDFPSAPGINPRLHPLPESIRFPYRTRMPDSYSSVVKDPHPRIRSSIQSMVDSALSLGDSPPTVTGEQHLLLWHYKQRAPSDEVMSHRLSGLSALVVEQLLHQHSRNPRLFNWLYDLTFARSWSAPIHLPNRGARSPDELSIELGSCAQGFLLALTSQLLESWIRQQSETFYQSILDEIERRLVRPFGNGAEVWWHPQPVPDDWMINNWTGVCGGCLLGMSVILEQLGRDCSAARNRAIDAINLYLHRAFTPGGECDEGIGYWCYGMEMLCLGLSQLDEQTLRHSIDMDRLRQVADYPRRVHINGPTFYASNDSRSNPQAPHLCSTWLARVTQNPFLARWPDISGFDAPRGLSPVLAARELQTFSPFDPDSSPPRDNRWLNDQQILIHQQRIAGQTVTLCMEGGHNAESHNHNDLGQVQLFLEDRAVLLDPGLPQYVEGFFGKDRYNHLNPSSLGHNVPIIRHTPQRSGKQARTNVVRVDPTTGMLCLDLTQAYPPEARLIRWRRQIDAGLLQVLDQIKLAEHGKVELCYWTDQSVRCSYDDCLVGQHVRIVFSPRPINVQVDVFSASDLMLRDIDPQTPYYRIRAGFDGTTFDLITRFVL